VSSSEYSKTGLQYDRHWIIVDETSHKVVTARESPKMVLITPSLDLINRTLHITIPLTPPTIHLIPIDPPITSTHHSDIWIWDDIVDGYSVDTPSNSLNKSLSTFLGKEVSLFSKGGSIPRKTSPENVMSHIKVPLEYGDGIGYGGGSEIEFSDGSPFLLASTSSLSDISSIINSGKLGGEEWRTKKLEMSRFRPNIVITGSEKWKEDEWLTIEIGVGKEILHLVSRCTRCLLPNVDPQSGVRDPVVPSNVISGFRSVDKIVKFSACFGMNCISQAAGGQITVGDQVRVMKKCKRSEDGTMIRPEERRSISSKISPK